MYKKIEPVLKRKIEKIPLLEMENDDYDSAKSATIKRKYRVDRQLGWKRLL